MRVIDERRLQKILAAKKPTKKTVLKILTKARAKKGLELEEVGQLLQVDDAHLQRKIFAAAKTVKEEIYGERLVFFAPLYVANFCVNDCDYCNFHRRNRQLQRKKLSLEEVSQEVEYLISLGHKRLLLEAGEDPKNTPIDYIVDVINSIYSVKTNRGNIRRLNVNIAATTTENYQKLKKAKIGTYQLFQETYHRPTYEQLHHGPKANFERQITAYERAFAAGLDDLGLGVLFGLYDWRYEVLALVAHAQYLDNKYGVGPHTISVPRFRPAPTVTYQPAYPVSDRDFLKLIAILRLAVPYTGMIISTREKPEIRKIAFQLGISQASAGSVTTVGGYRQQGEQGQFSIYDERKLNEVIADILLYKLLPSFCTACYRVGRTGETFMGLAKPGEIHTFCRPNGLLTFAEYLEDFATDGLYEKGYEVINYYLNKINSKTLRKKTAERLARIKAGERDLYF